MCRCLIVEFEWCRWQIRREQPFWKRKRLLAEQPVLNALLWVLVSHIIDTAEHTKLCLHCLTHSQYLSVNQVLFSLSAFANVRSLAQDLLSLLSNQNNRYYQQMHHLNKQRYVILILQNKLKYKPLLINDTFNT